jgi:hypothetical protein
VGGEDSTCSRGAGREVSLILFSRSQGQSPSSGPLPPLDPEAGGVASREGWGGGVGLGLGI